MENKGTKEFSVEWIAGAIEYGIDKSMKGKDIDNLPAPNEGKCTGYYIIDLLGCWWQVMREDKTTFWMIGEYPRKGIK